jgi:hypothetical protein
MCGSISFFCAPTNEAHAKKEATFYASLESRLIDNSAVDVSLAKNCNRFEKNNKNT